MKRKKRVSFSWLRLVLFLVLIVVLVSGFIISNKKNIYTGYAIVNGTCTDDDVGIRFVRNNEPSYCDIDKTVKLQKNSGVNCVNNFECRSNKCSDGKCYLLVEEVKKVRSDVESLEGEIQKVKSEVSIFKKLACGIKDLLKIEGYNECIEVPPASVCGNAQCETGESCSSCPGDCGECGTEDLVPPVITSSISANHEFSITDFPFVFNVDLNERGSVNYSLTNGKTNISMSTNNGRKFTSLPLSLNPGAYNISIFAQDIAGNKNSILKHDKYNCSNL